MSRNKKKSSTKSDMGIFNPETGLDDMEKMMYGNVEGNSDLEAELAALMGGGSVSPKRTARSQPGANMDISRMAAAAVQDEDEGADDEIDENDPDLLAELAGCLVDTDIGPEPPHSPSKTQDQNSRAVIQLISDRTENYLAAISAAKSAKETSKVRRYERSLGTLHDLAKKAEKGSPVTEDDVPPEVVVKATPRPSGQAMVMNMVNPAPAPPPPQPAPRTAHVQQPAPQSVPLYKAAAQPAPVQQPASGRVNSNTLSGLTERQNEYKSAALRAKNIGNIEQAKEFLMVSKQFDGAIEAVKNGEDFDLAEMPPTPEATPPTPESAPAPLPVEPAKQTPSSGASSSGGNLLTALQDRLNVFKILHQKSEQEENERKMRRYKRIIDQYTEAVTACRTKKSFDYASLFPPPGADPLSPSVIAAAQSAPMGPAAAQAQRPGGPPPKLSRQLSRSCNQQMVFLTDRQNKFKAAAINARNRGQIDLAKQLLRQSKSFDQVIRAAESGLPVDLSKMPSLPGEKTIDFEFLEAEECELPDDLQGEDRDTTYTRLQRNLINQIKTARDNALRFLKIGDVLTGDKFEKLAKTCQLDLQALENANNHGDPVPRFHYEWKSFSVMQANPDLAENDFELTVIRGTDLAVPSGFRGDQLDTYIKIEFPLPSDSPQSHQTDTVKSTNSPEYNSVAKFQASRKSRAFLRLIQSKGIKFDIMYRRGILKKDGVLGTVVAKLPQLEHHCTSHESFDIMEGRKAIGGKLEIRARIREPIAGKQVEEMKEKWLVIDDYERPKRQTCGTSNTSQVSVESIEVMIYERNMIHQKMQKLRSQLTPAMLQALSSKMVEWEGKIRTLEKTRQGKPDEVKRYITTISQLIPRYTQEAQAFLKQGDREKAQIQMTKKNLVEKEIAQLKSKVGLR